MRRAAFGLLSAALLFRLASAKPAGRSPVAASAVLTSNEVLAVPSGTLTSDNAPVGAGFFVPFGAVLRLSTGGRAIIRRAGEGALLIFGPAQLQLPKESPSVALARGGVLVSVGPKAEPFRVTTRTATVDATKGEFFIEARGKKETYVCACDAAIEVSNTQGKKAVTRIPRGKHTAYDYKVSLDQFMQTHVAQERHSDEDVAALLSAVKTAPKIGAPR